MSHEPQPTRIAMTVGSTTRNGGEFEFKKISLSLERDLAALENPVDAYRSIKSLLERMVTEFQAGKPRNSLTVSEFSNTSATKTQQKSTPPPSPPASKLAALQEQLGARLQDLEVVEGFDGLGVKPKKYLGDVWAEVNEVIRALGGKWQKGQTPKDGAWRIPK
jgi:hypothetical protein